MISSYLQKNTNYPSEVFSESDFGYCATLDERHLRLFLADKAKNLGRNGVALISAATGVNRKTIYRGIHDLDNTSSLEKGRIRQKGGGRKKTLNLHPEYLDAFDTVVESNTAGLPQDDTVKWLDLTALQIRDKLKEDNVVVSPYIVRQMLDARNFKRRSCLKSKTLKDAKDRDAQFRKIESIRKECEEFNVPVISMDTKKKEPIGNFKRNGSVYCKSAPKTFDHDFNSFAQGMIAPHALYDINANVGYVTLGTSHDTAEFVCDNIERIWCHYMQYIYTDTDTICLLCDGGGSNSSSHHIFKQSLIELAQRIEMNIIVCHYPPYCSKWNPVEHKLFSHITRSWSGAPLLSIEQARRKAEETTTSKGLVVHADVNNKTYNTNMPIKESYETLKKQHIVFDDMLPKWNYVVKYDSAL